MEYVRSRNYTPILINNTIESSTWAHYLSPSYWGITTIKVASGYLHNDTNLTVYRPTGDYNLLYGFAAAPSKYYIESYTDKINFLCEYPQDILWYDEEGNVIREYVGATNSLVFIKKKGTRMVYKDAESNVKELIIKSKKCPMRGSIYIYFIDKYGLYQSSLLNLGQYEFSCGLDSEFTPLHSNVSYYAKADDIKNSVEVGEEDIPFELKNYYEGLCLGNGVVWRNDDGVTGQGVISDTSLTSNYYGKYMAFSGILNTDLISDYD